MIRILKIFLRIAVYFFCCDISVKNKYLLKTKGPLLIIANHPNSFLDAIIIGTQYDRKVYFLARGDVFKKKFHRFLLRCLHLIPIYRLKEGKENLHLNEYAFNESIQLLSKGEAVLIFIEGICVNSNQLQPFKKGATRILELAHKKNINPIVHFAGIAYNQLRGIGKKINIDLTEITFNRTIYTPKDRLDFNRIAYQFLNQNIHPPQQKTIIHKNLLYYFHLPYYRLIKKIVTIKTKGTVLFDSVLFSLLFFTYPFYLLIIFFTLFKCGLSLPIIFGILLCILVYNKNTIEV